MKLEDNDGHFDVYMKKIRDPPNFDPQELAEEFEDTDDFVGKVSQWQYEYEYLKGYDSLGGFVEHISVAGADSGTPVAYFLLDEILDLKINSMVIEFITYNGNQ